MTNNLVFNEEIKSYDLNKLLKNGLLLLLGTGSFCINIQTKQYYFV